ncbi:ORF 73 [Cryptosporidium ryanae]|uniref:ORF 73 n=1 Tax=Cryptosporidium ryanae TaxID=515981 RepID=UPI003519E140|nr:ORF 73 [Cryptosporidium ryanae]
MDVIKMEYHPFQDYIKSGIADIEVSTRKIVEGEARRFEAYIDILKDQMASLNELEEKNELLQSEIACITEKLSLRELEVESKEKRIFELEKEAGNSAKDRKNFEKEYSKLIKEKQSLIKELSELHSKLQIVNDRNSKLDGGLNGMTNKNKKRPSQNESGVENMGSESSSSVKKSRLRRPQNEDTQQIESKKSIAKESGCQKAEGVSSKKGNAITEIVETNPLKAVLEKTNLGKIRMPMLKGKVVKAAEAANPNLLAPNYSLELKSASEDARVSNSTKSKSNKKADLKKEDTAKQRSVKKTSKVAKVAKIPHYTENVLNSMKVPELKDICCKINLEINQKSRKQDIINAILSFQGE